MEHLTLFLVIALAVMIGIRLDRVCWTGFGKSCCKVAGKCCRAVVGVFKEEEKTDA